MYRHANKDSKNLHKSNSNQNQQTRQGIDDSDSVLKTPYLRRIVVITNYDTGKQETHKLELYKTDRIDCYKVLVDGRFWKNRIGWTNILVGSRKALPGLLRE